MDLPKRFIERAGVSLPSREELHIYREPPKSIMTRKHEPVDMSDVTWMIRPDGPASDPSRINEGISYFAKGVNPSVEVDYQNRGGSATTTKYIHQPQVGSAYKVEVVRPPLYPAETLLPLSRPRIHQNKTVETNPGLSSGMGNTIAYDYDVSEAVYSINKAKASGPKTVQATATYKLEQPTVMSAKWAINENKASPYDVVANPGMNVDLNQYVQKEESAYGTIIRPKYTVTSNVNLKGIEERNDDASSKVRKEVLFQNIRPNFQIVLYDPTNHNASEVSANIKEKTNIAVKASLGMPIVLDRQDGTKIRLKDYTWTAVQTNVGIDQVILTIEDPEIELDRNVPVYSSNSNASLPTDITNKRNTDYNLQGKITAYADSNIDLSSVYNEEGTRRVQDILKLRKEVFHESFDNPPSFIPNMTTTREHPQIKTKDTNS